MNTDVSKPELNIQHEKDEERQIDKKDETPKKVESKKDDKKKKPTFTVVNFSFGELDTKVHLSIDNQKISFKSGSFFIWRNIYAIFIIFFFIVTGTFNTLWYKFQNESAGKFGDGPPTPFVHPWTQSWQMFFGMMFCCLFPHWILKFLRKFFPAKPKELSESEKKKKEEEEKKPINPLLFILPSICDVIASTLLSVALIWTYASVYQMLQCVTVVFTFVLSIILLKRNFYKFPHMWFGVLLVFVGSFLVGLNTVIYPQGVSERARAVQPFWGAMIVLAECFVYALFYIFEEWFYAGFETSPLQVAGYEGFWGFTIILFILFVLYFIPGADYGTVENFPASLAQSIDNLYLGLWVILLMFTIGIYNLMGNVITQTISCSTRAVLDNVRAFLIWLIQLWRGRQDFTYLQLAGFIVMTIGIMIYNEFLFNLIVPWYMKWVNKVNADDEEKKKKKKKKKSPKRRRRGRGVRMKLMKKKFR